MVLKDYSGHNINYTHIHPSELVGVLTRIERIALKDGNMTEILSLVDKVLDSTNSKDNEKIRMLCRLSLRAKKTFGDLMDLTKKQLEIAYKFLDMKNTVSVNIFSKNNTKFFWVELNTDDFDVEEHYYRKYYKMFENEDDYFELSVYGPDELRINRMPKNHVRILS